MPPEPQCHFCGSYEVVQEALEDGAPLCEEHDHPIARKRLPLEDRLGDLGEAKYHLQEKLFGMPREPSDEQKEKFERIRRNLDSTIEKREKLKERLEKVQDECDHPKDWTVTQYNVAEEEDLDMVPESEMPEELPAVTVHFRCKLCGLQEQIYMEGKNPEEINEPPV